MTEESEEEFPLIAQLVQANLLQSQATSSALIDSLTERAEKAEATIHTIRKLVQDAFNGDYLPNPERVLSYLYPSSQLIDHFRRKDAL